MWLHAPAGNIGAKCQAEGIRCKAVRLLPSYPSCKGSARIVKSAYAACDVIVRAGRDVAHTYQTNLNSAQTFTEYGERLVHEVMRSKGAFD